MEQKKYQITINPTPLKSKPLKSDNSIGIIYNNLNLVTGITVNEIAAIVQQPYGYTWSGGVFNGSVLNNTWESQSVIGLDFDNKDRIIYPEEVIKRLENYSITPQVWYRTFSSTDEIIKFRMMLLLDNSIVDPNHHEVLMKGLKTVFPEADSKCFRRGGFFFAGTKSEIISQEPINTLKLTDHLSIELITKDQGRTRKIAPLKRCSFLLVGGSENGEKGNNQYSYNKKKGNSPNYNDVIPEGKEPLKIDWSEAIKKVKILNEFINGKWLTHDELFGLATNLLKFEGGRKLLKETMYKFNEQGLTSYTENNFNIFPYLGIVYYPPQPIHTFSDYEEDQHIYDFETEVLNQRGKIQIMEAIHQIPLVEAEEKLKNHFERVVNSDQKGKIHLFKLPTAIGKTKLLTTVKNGTIAIPTSKLKEEVTERMKVPYQMTPNPIRFNDPKINKIIDHYYSMGLQNKAVAVLHKIISGKFKYTVIDEDLKYAKDYLDQIEKCIKSDESVLTTHTRAIHNKFKHDTLIFDEDPIGSLVQINQIKISDLFVAELTLQNNRKDLTNVINILKNANSGEIMSSPIILMELDELVEKLSENTQIESNVFGFFASSYFVKDTLDPNLIHYVSRKELPDDKNIIILSATLNTSIYKLLFGNRIEVFDIGEVEQKGRIIQYTKRSCSRKGLGKYVNQISEIVGDKKVITFKSFTNQFLNASKEMYFGNCSGYDTLAGEDLVVVGTPHRNNVEYLLLAKVLGTNFKTSDTTMGFKEIEYNGFRFMFNCYDNAELREIQLGLIQSDLIQAVGRARTLRTEATVELYSNFPLRISHQFIWKE